MSMLPKEILCISIKIPMAFVFTEIDEAILKVFCATKESDWFQIGKRVRQGCILSPCLFNLYTEYIMRNAGLEKHKLESRLPGEISITSDMQMIPPLWQKVKRN